MQTHRLKLPTHEAFLREERHDPVTGDAFREGDEVVFCASCRSAFLKSSWEYMGGAHCGQRETLETFPKAQHIDVFEISELEDFIEIEDTILYSSMKTPLNTKGLVIKSNEVISKGVFLKMNMQRKRRGYLLLALIGSITTLITLFVLTAEQFFLPLLAFSSLAVILLFKSLDETFTPQLNRKLPAFLALGENYVHQLEKKTPYAHVKYLKAIATKQQGKIFVNFEIRVPDKTLHFEEVFNLKTPTELLYNLVAISQHTRVYFWSSMQGDRVIFKKLQDQYEGDLHFLEN